MTTHELAKLLLEKPDVPVVCQDGGDPSDRAEVKALLNSTDKDEFWDGTNWVSGPHVTLES